MKRTVPLLIVLMVNVPVVKAADTMIFPAKNGNITFNHKHHTDLLKECKNCHDKTPGRIANFGKDYAHKTCKGCHEVRGTGPTRCGLCHRK
ncbi:cytochrome c3 [Geobacter metallireducens RCH3]|uniref:Cytochrome c n=1 Tax=Geobacter metallireducens (strain ATCC 53774 / DSM 7210 / GS-15) TaxID=269799 RepID=Q39UJ9_GEOMG|nr:MULTISPECIES: cytochrome c7 [Geobacter]ABB32075.1 cytochrome c [Geobacter metallireducens GS-15]EHP88738.1 cytochrome c3 [Geobacter metallireducens RCH3]MBT1074492.1 cytochrome c family protein [Geobacter grbiciae]